MSPPAVPAFSAASPASPIGLGSPPLVPGSSPEPIVLPTPPTAARRPPLPVVATAVPVAASVALFLVTGSAFMLLFAALGPLIAVAATLDGLRGTRRARRLAAREQEEACAEAEVELGRRHEAERIALWAVRPDAVALLQRPGDVWRAAEERGDALVVGTGDGVSGTRVVGGDGADAAALRARAATLPGAPVVVPLGLGVCVVGPRVLAAAVARALLAQACLAHPPGRLSLLAAPGGEEWAAVLPHRGPGGAGSSLRLVWAGPGDGASDTADAVIAHAPPGAPVPSRCGAVLTLTGPGSAVLAHGAQRRDVRVTGLSSGQAAAVAAMLSAAAPGAETGPAAVALADLLDGDDVDGAVPAEGGLAAAIGRERDGVALVDLVADGPHAVVAGVTGSGKSELLVTWVSALSAVHTPDEVCFLLADFKGGTAFDPLTALPHVTGVITDLDGHGARRAIESLRAELRRRESELAEAGARDIRDPRVRMPRLVVVVDEFAAVLAEHPELHAVFVDVAARGRALGMHLVLGTQRITGVVRDALLANCPLRISLRVTDQADSRAVVGTVDAALLPGEPDGRGLALVRRVADAAPRLTRIALTSPTDLDRIATASSGGAPPRPPWLPALPARIPLSRARARATTGALVLGIADEPQRQRQPVAELIPGEDRGIVAVGAARSGKSTLVELLAAQTDSTSVVRVGPDLEQAWDAVSALVERPRRGILLLVDDLDTLAGSFPGEYGAAFLAMLERVVRAAGRHRGTVVITAQRLTGAIARIADLLPLRALLPLASRVDHVAAGGDPGVYDPSAPPGRAVLGGRVVQFAEPDSATAVATPPAETREWASRTALTAVVARPARVFARTLAAEAAEAAGARVVLLEDPGAVAEVDELVRIAEPAPVPPTVVVGDPDAWQRQWSLLSRLRAEHDVLVTTSCAPELRGLTGIRELPPYAERVGTAWLVSPAGTVIRVRVLRAPDDR